MVVCIAPHIDKDPALLCTAKAAAVLYGVGVSVLVPAELGGVLPAYVDRPGLDEAVARAEFVLTIGGDGTMLHMAERLRGTEKLLLGLNLGRMGFLTALEPDELPVLTRLAAKDFYVEERSLLSVCVNGEEVDRALNEAVVSSSAPAARTMGFSLYCEDVFVDNYRGDGIIFATPTGSTAYSLSAGGPILDSALSATVVTPVCAHRLASPSLVFDGARRLRLTLAKDNADTAFLTVDGRAATPLAQGDEVAVTRSGDTLRLVYFSAIHQLTGIDKKLR